MIRGHAVRASRDRAFAFAIATLLALLLVPGVADASVGDLTFVRCASNDGSGGACANLSGSSFDEPGAVTVSPGGDPIAAVRTSYNVTRFNSDLGFLSCASNVASAGLCTDLVAPPLYSPPGDVVVTPDGGTLYVSGPANDAVTRYALQPTGGLAYQGCVSNDGSGGACTNVPGSAFDAPAAMAISPDGDSLYVASRVSSSVTHFTIGAGGALSFEACASDSGSGGDCSNVPGTVFATPAVLAVSPDGGALYASASLSDTLTRFSLAPAGQMAYTGCVSNAATGTCTDLPGSPMLEPQGVAVAPGGAAVHVVATSSDSLVDLSVSPAGDLAFAGCSSQSGSAGTCADLPDAFDAPNAVAISPDGRSIYANASVSDSVSRFDAGAGGTATFAGCISDTGTGGICADLPGAGFDRPADLAMNAAGSALYVSAADSDSVTQLAREVPDTTPPGLTLKVKKKGKLGKPIAVTATCDEACSLSLSGTLKLKGGAVGRLPDRSAALAAGDPATVKLKPKGRLKRKLRRVGKARARITIVATDAAGNVTDAFAKQRLK